MLIFYYKFSMGWKLIWATLILIIKISMGSRKLLWPTTLKPINIVLYVFTFLRDEFTGTPLIFLDVCVNSFIVDKGLWINSSFLQSWGLVHSDQNSIDWFKNWVWCCFKCHISDKCPFPSYRIVLCIFSLQKERGYVDTMNPWQCPPTSRHRELIQATFFTQIMYYSKWWYCKHQ
jgi:hypothetical protein